MNLVGGGLIVRGWREFVMALLLGAGDWGKAINNIIL